MRRASRFSIFEPCIIRAIHFTPNFLVCIEQNGTMYVQSLHSSRLQKLQVGQKTAAPKAVASHMDMFLIGDGNGMIGLWDLAAGKRQDSFFHHRTAVTCLLLAKAEMLVASYDDGLIQIIHLVSNDVVQTLEGHQGSVGQLLYTEENALLASAGEDSTTKLWNIVTGQCLCTLSGQSPGLCKIAWVDKSRKLATGDSEGIIRIWAIDIGVMTTLSATLNVHTGSILELLPHDDLLISSATDGYLRITKSAEKKALSSFKVSDFPVPYVILVNNGIVTGDEEGKLKLWQSGTSNDPQILVDAVGCKIETVEGLATSASRMAVAIRRVHEKEVEGVTKLQYETQVQIWDV